MLYGKLSSLLPVLRADYPGLAAPPLTAHKVCHMPYNYLLNPLLLCCI
jgi:hypothetical protein